MGSARSQVVHEPSDPDTGPPVPAGHGVWHAQGPVVGVIAVGGGVGTAARYGASLLWPTPDGTFPWTTLVVNTTGCALIGVFLVLITEVWAAHRLVRPFVGTGVLGGFTTFSTYAVDVERLVDQDRMAAGLADLGGTLLAAMASVWVAVAATRRAVGAVGPRRGSGR